MLSVSFWAGACILQGVMSDETLSSVAAAAMPPTPKEPSEPVVPALPHPSADHDPEPAARESFRGKPRISGLPMQLDVTVPIPKFRVEDLLVLEKGAVVETSWPHTDDVPVWSGGAQLVWAEFEVLGRKLAVRVTRLK